MGEGEVPMRDKRVSGDKELGLAGETFGLACSRDSPGSIAGPGLPPNILCIHELLLKNTMLEASLTD